MGRFNGGNRSGGRDGFGKNRNSIRGGQGGRPSMHKATCSDCGNRCEVPFKPTNDKPIYCSNCFENKDQSNRGNRSNGGRRNNSRNDRSFNKRGRSDRPSMHKATCFDCGNSCEVPFKPTSDKPVYCSNCFEGKENSNNNRFKRRSPRRSNSRDRQMFEVVCDECQKDCKVPFKPSSDKPIYCDDCFGKEGRNSRNNNSEQNEKHFELINEKLDIILELLVPEALEDETEKELTEIEKVEEIEEAKKEMKEKKTTKKKATAKKISKKEKDTTTEKKVKTKKVAKKTTSKKKASKKKK